MKNDFSLLVDITEILANLNLHLQGKDQLCSSMLDRITCFTKKLELFIAQLKAGEIVHFRSRNGRQSGNSHLSVMFSCSLHHLTFICQIVFMTGPGLYQPYFSHSDYTY